MKIKKYKFISNKEFDIFKKNAIYSSDEKCKNQANVSWYVFWHPEDFEEVVEVDSPVSDNVYVTTSDPVNPQHYKNGDVECIEGIRAAVVGKDGFAGYLAGNTLKYIWRYESKGGVQDLEKASWYLNKLVQHEKGKIK